MTIDSFDVTQHSSCVAYSHRAGDRSRRVGGGYHVAAHVQRVAGDVAARRPSTRLACGVVALARTAGLIGPPSIAGGYSFGPIFYWTLWTYARVGRAFADSLPHTAVVVQAVVSGLIDLVVSRGDLPAAGQLVGRDRSSALAGLCADRSRRGEDVVEPNQALDFGKLAIALVLWGPADLTTARRMAIAGTAVLSAQSHCPACRSPCRSRMAGRPRGVGRAPRQLPRPDADRCRARRAAVACDSDGLEITSSWPSTGPAFTSQTLGGAISGRTTFVRDGELDRAISRRWHRSTAFCDPDWMPARSHPR